MKLEQLIKQCKKNKREAQRELFQEYKDTLYFLSLKYCRNEAEAEDNVQDSFLLIFQNIKKYNGKGSFEGWMKRITINKAIDKFKKNIKTSADISEEIKEDTFIEEDNFSPSLSTLLKVIQELPDRYRLVFNLFQLDNYSHKEIAEMLSISEGTSKSNYHRAKIILKEKLTQLQKTAS